MVLAPLGWVVPPESFEHLFHGFKGDLFPFTHVLNQHSEIVANDKNRHIYI
jgi:hypothetical protein